MALLVNKMMATQSAYDPDHPVTRYNVEIKSQVHETVSNMPELEIRHVRDRNTVRRDSDTVAAILSDTCSLMSYTTPSHTILSAEE
jgi:hypothetical protein